MGATLDAVNEMLRALGLRTVTTYATGTALEASLVLGQWSDKIQAMGWHCNREGTSRRYGDKGVELAPPDTTIAYTVAPSGTFLAGETVTETTSGATGRFQYLSGSKVYLTAISGAFTGGKVLTGATSAATVTGTTLATVTSGSIYVDHDILRADPINDSYPDATLRAGRFFDKENDTYDFSSALKVIQVRELDFDDLPMTLRELITVHALIDICAKIRVPVPQDAAHRLASAQIEAAREEQDRADLNLQDSSYFVNMSGRQGTVAPWR